jgi:hypothetical protein
MYEVEEVSMFELYSNGYRGLLVGGAALLWMVALMGGAQSSDLVTSPRPAPAKPVSASGFDDDQAADQNDKYDDVTELVIKSPRRRAPKKSTPEVIASVPAKTVHQPTYPVWFESESGLGKCKINWEGESMIANLHASARLPEGTHEFSYACGNRRGRASIEVEPKRVNGVLFCEDAGDVKVDTVRRDDGQCQHT